MKVYNKKTVLLSLLVGLLFNPPTISAQEIEPINNTSFEGNARIKAFVESTRKDYFDTVYSYDSPIPRYEKKQYDKSFYGTDTDLTFALKTDFNDTSFLDFKESVYVRHYNTEDPRSLDYSSNKYNEIDHNFNLTFGVCAGTYDYIQLAYINNIYDGGAFDSLNYKSNKGRALLAHDVAERTCLAFSGSYEEREYDTDKVLNYKEARAAFEVSCLLPCRNEYVQIANSSRGEKATFEKIPTGLSTRNAVDYYTTYVRNPRDDDPTAKYILNQTRGEIYIRGFGEIAERERTQLNNNCNEIVSGFETIYRTTDDMRFRLNEIYTNQDFKQESNINNLHDGFSNYSALTVDYDCSKNFSQSLTYSYEFYRYKKAYDENNKCNSVSYENFYSGKDYRTSLLLGVVKRQYYVAADQKPNETEKRAAFAFDYDIIKSLTFKLKAEYADLDYHVFEDEIFSNYKRHTWRVALEKGIGEYLSFETAFQYNKEKHSEYTQNNIEEKTVGVSLIGKF